MSEYTPITDELREYATFAWNPWPEARDRLYQMCDAIDAIHAQLERENAALKAELDRVLGEQENRDGWMELPKDADGVPIHVGDVMESDYIIRTEVAAVGVECFFAWSNIDRRWHQYEANQFRHHVPDTWERIIEDAVNVHGNGFNPSWTDERDALVARCKALAGGE